MSELRGDPNCSVCHGSGWDGEGYSLTCHGCRPSIMDLHVEKVLQRGMRSTEEQMDIIQKRCQIGTVQRADANELHADCYALIGELRARLKRCDEPEDPYVPIAAELKAEFARGMQAKNDEQEAWRWVAIKAEHLTKNL